MASAQALEDLGPFDGRGPDLSPQVEDKKAENNPTVATSPIRRHRRNAFGPLIGPAPPSGTTDSQQTVNPVAQPPASGNINRTALIAAQGGAQERRQKGARPASGETYVSILPQPPQTPQTPQNQTTAHLLRLHQQKQQQQESFELPYGSIIPFDSVPCPQFVDITDPAWTPNRNEPAEGIENQRPDNGAGASSSTTPSGRRRTLTFGAVTSPRTIMKPVPKPGPATLGPNSGLDEWLEEAKQCHYLPERVMKELCEMVKEVLMEESNIQPVCTPVTVCGDIHGQFYDLLELFRVAGGMPGETDVEAPQTATNVITSDDLEPPSSITNPKLKKKLRTSSDGTGSEAADDDTVEVEDAPNTDASALEANTSSQSAETRYIFLGDFVDRGYFSLETFTLLMCLKAKYPDRIVLVRGNHESRQITQVYGFYEECQQKYGNASVWKACCHVFDFLVLAAIVDGEILCVHGGLSPEIRTIDQIRVVARAQEIPHEGAFCDLVWSDPEEIDTWAVSPRGAGWLFGNKVATEFNHVNGLKLIARAHQLVNEGYKYHFPQNSVVTVWSAPNYCYRCGNVASIMAVGNDLNPKFSIFSAVPDEQRHVPPNRRGPSDYFL